ncbi:hypothetical protein [Roseiterribacter gracilis]|uniref:Uncharacterized protein n=1 Tax=Roseiterribacter gracilis TaxID=2812848 RepID=A0A8S8XIG7_9PROT|nr:hypothetical protein TMPK1_39960 [Rhodospirillales bacterium TMPK1]
MPNGDRHLLGAVWWASVSVILSGLLAIALSASFRSASPGAITISPSSAFYAVGFLFLVLVAMVVVGSIGLPVHWALRDRNVTSAAAYVSAGAAITTLPALIFYCVAGSISWLGIWLGWGGPLAAIVAWSWLRLHRSGAEHSPN